MPENNAMQYTHQKTVKVTVFIHGTILPIPSIQSAKEAAMVAWKTKKIELTIEAYYYSLRSNSFYKNQIIGKPELHEILKLSDDHWVNWALTSAYRYMHETFLPDDNKTLLFYSFGWNGRFRSKKRRTAADDLYDALIKKRKELAETYPDHEIEFSLVTHSLAGEIALRLAHIEEEKKENLTIHELISFGAPVQQETHDAAEHAMFKKIYHFFSHGDYVQIMDIFTTSGWSNRKFETEDPSVIQISLDVNGTHPGHASLSFYGSRFHEPTLAINPLPPLVFAPWMIAWLNKNSENQTHHHLSIRTDGKIISLMANGKETKQDQVNLEELKKFMDVDNSD